MRVVWNLTQIVFCIALKLNVFWIAANFTFPLFSHLLLFCSCCTDFNNFLSVALVVRSFIHSQWPPIIHFFFTCCFTCCSRCCVADFTNSSFDHTVRIFYGHQKTTLSTFVMRARQDRNEQWWKIRLTNVRNVSTVRTADAIQNQLKQLHTVLRYTEPICDQERERDRKSVTSVSFCVCIPLSSGFLVSFEKSYANNEKS